MEFGGSHQVMLSVGDSGLSPPGRPVTRGVVGEGGMVLDSSVCTSLHGQVMVVRGRHKPWPCCFLHSMCGVTSLEQQGQDHKLKKTGMSHLGLPSIMAQSNNCVLAQEPP